MKRGRKANLEISFSLDTIEWAYADFLQPDFSHTSRIELYTAPVMGFFFLLRIGVGKLRMSDIRLGRDDDQNDTVTITIRNRKTDQFNK